MWTISNFCAVSCFANDDIIALGASLHNILTRLKAQPQLYPAIDVSYSSTQPLVAPVILTLPHNGLRLRFDGADQRLRLIEVLDFTKTHLTYNNTYLVKPSDDPGAGSSRQDSSKPTGPAFRQVYNKLFGITFAGEYLGAPEGTKTGLGTYVLSYPGVAFIFPVRDSSWAPLKEADSLHEDFVSLLSSSATLSATSLLIFSGKSWTESREGLYTHPCSHPRSLALGSRGKEGLPDEIEFVKVCGHGRLEFERRLSATFALVMNETTVQDLVAEFGPPDAIYRKNDRRLSIHKEQNKIRPGEHARYSKSPVYFDGLSESEQVAVTDDSDSEESRPATDTEAPSTECFYNYFYHGFDVFVSCPSSPAPALVPSDNEEEKLPFVPGRDRLVATKVLLHGNVPGSYPFNRYRRSRWYLDPEKVDLNDATLHSETPFKVLSSVLQDRWSDTYAGKEQAKNMQRAMVLNRGWGDSPGSSCELLGSWEERAETSKKEKEPTVADGAAGLGNTNLFGFPGLLFEVLKNDTVSCLTVY